MAENTAQQIAHIEALAEKLSPTDHLLLVQRLTTRLLERMQPTPDDDPNLVWSDEEVEEFLRPETPMTGRQMIEAGLVGGWEDMGITDSVKWVNEQRRARRERNESSLNILS